MVSNKWGSGALLEKWVQGMQPQHTGQFFRNNLNETKTYQAFKMYHPCFSVYYTAIWGNYPLHYNIATLLDKNMEVEIKQLY